MIAPLRRRHRILFLLLDVALPLLLVAAIFLRPEPAAMEDVPSPLEETTTGAEGTP
jgi:hypothetical protein